MGPTNDRGEVRRAVGARDAARARLRRTTGLAVAGAVALGGVLASFAAGATHPKKAPAPTATRSARHLRPLAAAPVPPLVAVQSAGDSSASSQSPQATAPAPSYQPPVVSSGGS